MESNSQLDKNQKDYIYSWETPVEADFFTAKENDRIDKENKKLQKTEDYLDAVSNNPGLGGQLERDIATGVIYSQGEMSKVLQRRRALERMGNRIFPGMSVVSPKGQRIIMSRYFADSLGFMTDGYILADELEDLVGALKSEGVLDDKTSKVKRLWIITKSFCFNEGHMRHYTICLKKRWVMILANQGMLKITRNLKT